MTRLLLLIVFLGLLHGCAPAMVAGAAGGAAAAHDERSAAAMLEDNVIEARAKDSIYGDPELVKKVHVNVTSVNHVVLLTGETLSGPLRDKVVDMVSRLEKVKRVHNEIRVADLTDFQSRANDTWLTSKVKTQMIATKGFDSTRVNVTTENGTVYLMGLVTHAEGDKATDIARNVDGVKRVVKLFEYIDGKAS
jgi:osmotically-inducible protein OsmY